MHCRTWFLEFQTCYLSLDNVVCRQSIVFLLTWRTEQWICFRPSITITQVPHQSTSYYTGLDYLSKSSIKTLGPNSASQIGGCFCRKNSIFINAFWETRSDMMSKPSVRKKPPFSFNVFLFWSFKMETFPFFVQLHFEKETCHTDIFIVFFTWLSKQSLNVLQPSENYNY